MNPLDRLCQSVDQANRAWTGCCWPTQFGPGRLNLEGTQSRHALLLAAATRGDESAQWRAAARWLAGVEADAAAARQHATVARRALCDGQFETAIVELTSAAKLEEKYSVLTHYRVCRQQSMALAVNDVDLSITDTT